MRLLPLMALAAACSSVSTHYDYDTSFDFSKLKRYSWAKPAGKAEENPLVVQRVRDATEAELKAKGFERADGGADFLVAIYTGKQSRIQVNDWGYGYGPRGAWYGGGVDVYQYEEGTLILDVVDGASKRLVWRGTAVGIIDESLTPEERTQKIRAAVAKILSRFPPPK
jgi:hypothetical protein